MVKEQSGKKKAHGKKGGMVHTHNVMHHAPSTKHHNKEYDPVYIGVGDLQPHHIAINEQLTKKDRHAMQKLEAQLEYAEAHGEETEKIQARMEAVNNKELKHKAGQGDPVKVTHSGGHWKHHLHHKANSDKPEE